MDETARLGASTLLVSAALVASAALASSGCGGGDQPPPTTPVAKVDAPPAAPATASATAPAPADSAKAPTESTSAPTPPAPTATADGPWPFAGFTAADRTAQLDRLKKDPGPIKSNWVPPGKSDRYGHAEGLISAPADAVRAKLQNFTNYKELAGPKFKSVKVVDKQGQSTDVYFQLPIMKGMVTIWYVTRFPPSRQAGGGDVLEGTFVKGNIKDMHIAFTVRPGADDKSSVLVCDLILRPNVPAPQAALDEELRDACGDAINSLRKTIAASP